MMALLPANLKRKEDVAMQVKSGALRMMLIVGLLLGPLAAPGVAAQDDTKEVAVPRSFQGARLGMTMSELGAVVPDVNRVALTRRDQAQRTVVIPSKDRYLQRVEYRFYSDRLRELAIYYNPVEVPGGYPRLLERLKNAYGKPIVIDQRDEYGLGSKLASDVISAKKTIWKDRTTMASLAESRRIIDNKRDLLLTITDLDLQRAFEEDQEHRRRQQELRIPIPVPDTSAQNKQVSVPQSDQLPG
jgi:hypothetical protein